MKYFYTAFFIFFSILLAIGQETHINGEIKNHIKSLVNEGYTPSVALSYIDGAVIENFNYGNTKLENGNAVNENSVYEIGSITKVFTCIILADEVLKGNMSLDDPVSKYLPNNFKAIIGENREITLKDLATHTSGLPRMPTNFNPKDAKNPFADYTVSNLYEFLESYELPRLVGIQYEYSNLAMGLLGHILELKTGRSYSDLIKERITKPLKMYDTDIILSENMQKNLAYGYDAELKLTKNWDLNVLAGAGAIKSTTNDMIKFYRANVDKDDSDLNKAMQLTHKVAFEDETTKLKIGLAWHYNTDGTIIWHNGGTGGYRSFGGFVKDTDKAVIVFTNTILSVDVIGVKQLGLSVELKLPVKKEHPQEVEVSDEILKSYVGKYQLTPNFFITVRFDDGKLVTQATGQQEFEIFASAENKFFLKVVEASITFNKNETGVIDSLTLYQAGQAVLGKKIE